MCGGRASSAIEIEAKVTRFRKATANVEIQVYTPGSDSSSRQLYADMKVCATCALAIPYFLALLHATRRIAVISSDQGCLNVQVLYMVMPEEKFRGQFVRGSNNCYADMESAKKQVRPGLRQHLHRDSFAPIASAEQC